jgi:hypothetical protein
MRAVCFTLLTCSLTAIAGAITYVQAREPDARDDKQDRDVKAADSAPSKDAPSKDAKSKSSRAKSPPRSSRKVAGFTEEREAAAMTFVRAYHPELADLLDQLKLSNTTEYQRAIRDLFKSSEKLAQVQEKSPARYELELELWKVDSRIQVLLARLTMSPDAALKAQLKEALAEKLQLCKQQVIEDRLRAVARLDQLDRKLQELQRDPEAQIDQQLNELLSNTQRTRTDRSQKSGESKPAESKADGLSRPEKRTE